MMAKFAFGIIEIITKASCIEAPLLFLGATVPGHAKSDSLWTDGTLWTCDVVNRTAPSANSLRKSLHEVQYEVPLGMGPGLFNMHDTLLVLPLRRNVITTRKVTWRARQMPMLPSWISPRRMTWTMPTSATRATRKLTSATATVVHHNLAANTIAATIVPPTPSVLTSSMTNQEELANPGRLNPSRKELKL